MFNDNQMKKIMRKASKPVEEKFRRMEEEDKKKEQDRIKMLVLIRDELRDLQNKYFDRGACVCVSGNSAYVLKGNRAEMFNISIEDVQTLDMVKVSVIGCFYMASSEVYLKQKKMYDWVAARYARIRFSVVAAKKEGDFISKMSNMSVLGSIFNEFSNEFPDETIDAFIEIVRTLDIFIESNITI